MSRIYDENLDCGCMISEDGGGGMILCESGLWEITPPDYQGERPKNYETYVRCMKERFGQPREQMQTRL